MLRLSWPALGLGLAAGAIALMAHAPPARACGGCFHGEPPANTPPSEVASVVTDHRMAVSISPTQTVLWDQVQYAGDPREFAWVLPVRAGARLELAHDEWLASLEATSRTTVLGPAPKSCGGGGGSTGSSGGFGCGTTTMAMSAAEGPGGGGTDASAVPGVDVIHQAVVGPYETVTLRAADGGQIDAWLRANGYVIPAAIEPVLARYAKEGFDFIALRLRPGRGVQAMRPVRVASPGADATLPLRMVAAGIGANVGLTLYVISEGRYRPRNFPEATIDPRRVTWDARTSRSNYTSLATERMAEQGGRTWLTECAYPLLSGSSLGGNPQAMYDQSCRLGPGFGVPCTEDAGASDAASEAGQDASDDAGEAGLDAAGEGGPKPAPPACFTPDSPCDDAQVAALGLHPRDIWVTKLRAYLPAGALDLDLQLEPAPDRASVPNVIATQTLADPTYDPCGPASNGNVSEGSSGCVCATPRETGGSGGPLVLLGGVGLAASLALARRLRRRRAT